MRYDETARRQDVLLYCLLQILLSRVKLLLEELDFAEEFFIAGLGSLSFG